MSAIDTLRSIALPSCHALTEALAGNPAKVELGQIISAYTAVSNRAGRVVLLSPSMKTDQLLQIAKLVTVFDVYDQEADAVAALMMGACPGTLQYAPFPSRPSLRF